ncbi:MAG: anthranilate synthase component I family protein [Nocardioides sp.]
MSDPATDPVALFGEIAGRYRRCFWLDGGGARDWSAKRSMIGWLDDHDVSLTYDAAAREVRRHAGGESVVVGDDVFEALEREIPAGRPDDHWIGYFGYAARHDLPARRPERIAEGAGRAGLGIPDAIWMRPRGLRFFEHAAVDPSDEYDTPAEPAGRPPPASYEKAFEVVREHLRAGNSYEVNLTYRAEATSDLDPARAYLRLRRLNPAPYAGFLQHDVPGHRGWLLSSSPERYALITEDRWLETKPIKGTTERGGTPEADRLSRLRLAGDPRFRAENLMITDLLRNDLATVCDPGTVEVPQLMQVESYPGVHQLVSTVRGRLRTPVSTVAALRALFPAGSMTGAPKRRTMEIIGEVEDSPRGVYAGAFGWICADGRADLGVVIRSLMTDGTGRYELGTGGGITVQSVLADEYAESCWKVARLRRVFEE